MDLDDQELFSTQIKKKLYKRNELKQKRKEYTDIIKDLLWRVNLIDKEINDVER